MDAGAHLEAGGGAPGPLIALAQPAAPPPEPVLTRPPVLERFVEAAYPPEAEAAKLEGKVLLDIDISATGEVTRVEVVEPAGHGFDEAAVAAVRQFHFTPAEVDGKPSPVRIHYAYDFVLRPVAVETPVPQQGPVNLSGRVLERGTRRPVGGAEVALPSLSRSTTTDAQGGFSFRDVPPGSVPVVVTAAEYQRFDTSEAVQAGKETRVTYHLLATFGSPYETVVRSNRDKKEVSETTLSLQEIQHPGHHRRCAEGHPEPAGSGPTAVQRG